MLPICPKCGTKHLNRAASRKQFPIILSKLPPEEIAAFQSDDPTFFQKHGVLFPVLREKDRTGFERLWDKALKQRKQ